MRGVGGPDSPMQYDLIQYELGFTTHCPLSASPNCPEQTSHTPCSVPPQAPLEPLTILRYKPNLTEVGVGFQPVVSLISFLPPQKAFTHVSRHIERDMAELTFLAPSSNFRPSNLTRGCSWSPRAVE